MAATRDAPSSALRDGAPGETLYRKLSPGPGKPAQAVAVHQCARIHAAMVEIVGVHGYNAVTVRELTRLASVSTRAFYEHFEGKDDCFLRTFDLVVQRAGGRIVMAQQGEPEWREQLRLAFCAFARELDEKPHVGRLALIETLVAGPAALERLRRAEAMFETMIGESFARAPDGIAVPPLLIEGIVAGVAGVARTRLLSDDQRELVDLADEMVEWALCYRSEVAAEFGRTDCRVAEGDAYELSAAATSVADDLEPGDERALILSAVAKLSATDGYWQLTVPRIRAAAGVSRKSFDRYFEGIEDCFLAALEVRIGHLLSRAMHPYAGRKDWPEGIHRVLVKICAEVARDPVLARLGFIEVFAPGLAGMLCRERLMSGVTTLFRDSAPSGKRPSRLAAEASVGAVWGIVHHHVVAGRTHRLPQIAPMLSFLALSPVVGATAVGDSLRAEG